MFLGGLVVVGLWKLVGTSDYLGLGVPMILRAFVDPHLPVYAFALKLVFTAVTLGAGFLGGEVTPLFFVGATLGSVLARWLGIPLALGAGDGAEMRRPLGISIVGGLLVSQLLTLYTTPVVYIYLDRFRLWALKKSGRQARAATPRLAVAD